VSHSPAVSTLDRPPPELRSTAKTAALLDCSIRTVYRLVDRGELRPVRLGRVLRFELDEIERYLSRHRDPGAVP
jgi:excisionase family DNA binding protein